MSIADRPCSSSPSVRLASIASRSTVTVGAVRFFCFSKASLWSRRRKTMRSLLRSPSTVGGGASVPVTGLSGCVAAPSRGRSCAPEARALSAS